MKAISLKQPFAALVAAGVKKYETRKWKTEYRGPLLIQASLMPHSLFCGYNFESQILELDNWSAKRFYNLSRYLIPHSGEMICVVDLVDIRPFENKKEVEDLACCDWYDGYIWKLENPRQTYPIPIKGQLGLFDVPDELIKYIKP